MGSAQQVPGSLSSGLTQQFVPASPHLGGAGGGGEQSRPHPLRTRSAGWYKAVLCPRRVPSSSEVTAALPLFAWSCGSSAQGCGSKGSTQILPSHTSAAGFPVGAREPQVHAEGCGGRGRLLGSSWKLGSTPALGPSSLFPRKDAKWPLWPFTGLVHRDLAGLESNE